MSAINDTRAHPLQQNQPAEAPAIPPPLVVVRCKDCKHWNRVWPKANHAQCLLATKFAASPLMTTDLQTCSQGERKA
jgi:hypothetical protein